MTQPPIFIISFPFRQDKYFLYLSLKDSIVLVVKNPACLIYAKNFIPRVSDSNAVVESVPTKYIIERSSINLYLERVGYN